MLLRALLITLREDDIAMFMMFKRLPLRAMPDYASECRRRRLRRALLHDDIRRDATMPRDVIDERRYYSYAPDDGHMLTAMFERTIRCQEMARHTIIERAMSTMPMLRYAHVIRLMPFDYRRPRSTRYAQARAHEFARDARKVENQKSAMVMSRAEVRQRCKPDARRLFARVAAKAMVLRDVERGAVRR